MTPENNQQQQYQQQMRDASNSQDVEPPVSPLSSQVQPQPQAPNNSGARKSRKPLIAILVLLLTIVLGGIAYAVFSLGSSDGDSSGSQNNAVQRQQDAISPDNLAEKLKKYTEEVGAAFPQYTNVDMHASGEGRSVALFSEYIDGFVGLSSEKDGWSGTISRSSEGSDDDSTDNIVHEYLLQLFKDDGFSDYDGELYSNEWRSDELSAVLESSGVVCEVSMSGGGQLLLACAELADLPELAKKLKPFYDAYISANENLDRHSIIISTRIIERVDRYQEYETATGSVAVNGYGASTSFYRHNQGEWQYGYSGHDAPACSSFATDHARRAFYDRTCYSSNDISDQTISTVGEYFSL